MSNGKAKRDGEIVARKLPQMRFCGRLGCAHSAVLRVRLTPYDMNGSGRQLGLRDEHSVHHDVCEDHAEDVFDALISRR